MRRPQTQSTAARTFAYYLAPMPDRPRRTDLLRSDVPRTLAEMLHKYGKRRILFTLNAQRKVVEFQDLGVAFTRITQEFQ